MDILIGNDLQEIMALHVTVVTCAGTDTTNINDIVHSGNENMISIQNQIQFFLKMITHLCRMLLLKMLVVRGHLSGGPLAMPNIYLILIKKI